MKSVEQSSDPGERDEFLVFGSPSISEEGIAEVVGVLRSGWIGTGPKVDLFEEHFRAYTGARYAIAVSSCTAALHLSLLAAGIGRGDDVITTPMTFVATANSIVHAGATPVFVDIDRASQLIDPAAVEACIQQNYYMDGKTGLPVNRETNRRLRAIIPVHLGGRPCAMDDVADIAARYNLYVIEDAAHAIEAEYRGRKVGAISDFTCFSFYVTKNLVTGEGGMVTTDSEEFANHIKTTCLHGMTADAWTRYNSEETRDYDVINPGFKYNMTDIQAALGVHQVKHLTNNLAKRAKIWQAYDEAFSDLPVERPSRLESDTVHARHLYSLLVDKDRCGVSRDEVRRGLHRRKIGTGVHYRSVHELSFYRNAAYNAGPLPNAEYVSGRTFSIPLAPHLTSGDVQDVVEAVHAVLRA